MVPTRRYTQYFNATQYWTVQTSVLNAGVQAQLNDVSYRIEDANSLTLQARAEMAALKGDPRLEDATKALDLATTALIQGLGKQDSRFRQEIGELYALVVGLSQQVAETQQRQRTLAQDVTQEAERSALQGFVTHAAAAGRLEAKADATQQAVDVVRNDLANITTDEVPEGTALYFTNGRADARIAAAVGSSVQAYDADLSAIGALTPSDDDFLQRKSGVWTNRTVAQVKTDLGLGTAPLTFDLASGSALALTSGTAADLGYIDLPDGTWLVQGSLAFIPAGGTTMSVIRAWVTTTAATQPVVASGFASLSATIPAGFGQTMPTGGAVITASGGTGRVYLGTRCSFSGGTLSVWGHMNAVRTT